MGSRSSAFRQINKLKPEWLTSWYVLATYTNFSLGDVKLARGFKLEDLLGANLVDFFNNSNVGLAVFDHQVRFQALNPHLARINGLSVESHIGKTPQELLGEAVLPAQLAAQQVLATGQAIANLEIAGTLQTKLEAGRWVDNFFPMTDSNGRITHVGAVVVEVPAARNSEKPSFDYEAASPGTVMRSWKEIAHYLAASVKTVQRWEREYNLPVRRLRASKGVEVFGLREELDGWIHARTQRRENAPWDVSTLKP
ncbi:MAG TPA: PAS domain-containing protein [Terriglobales bacterium]|nr:PAS domain-containing protein [Terriglobales bacterium]